MAAADPGDHIRCHFVCSPDCVRPAADGRGWWPARRQCTGAAGPAAAVGPLATVAGAIWCTAPAALVSNRIALCMRLCMCVCILNCRLRYTPGATPPSAHQSDEPEPLRLCEPAADTGRRRAFCGAARALNERVGASAARETQQLFPNSVQQMRGWGRGGSSTIETQCEPRWPARGFIQSAAR